MTNDEVREILSSKNITSGNVTVEQVQRLRKILNKNLKESGIHNGTARLTKFKLRNYKFLEIQTSDWKGRECVSFNRDGFIGFAGWAGTNNLKPILGAVIEWSSEL